MNYNGSAQQTTRCFQNLASKSLTVGNLTTTNVFANKVQFKDTYTEQTTSLFLLKQDAPAFNGFLQLNPGCFVGCTYINAYFMFTTDYTLARRFYAFLPFHRIRILAEYHGNTELLNPNGFAIKIADPADGSFFPGYSIITHPGASAQAGQFVCEFFFHQPLALNTPFLIFMFDLSAQLPLYSFLIYAESTTTSLTQSSSFRPATVSSASTLISSATTPSQSSSVVSGNNNNIADFATDTHYINQLTVSNNLHVNRLIANSVLMPSLASLDSLPVSPNSNTVSQTNRFFTLLPLFINQDMTPTFCGSANNITGSFVSDLSKAFEFLVPYPVYELQINMAYVTDNLSPSAPLEITIAKKATSENIPGTIVPFPGYTTASLDTFRSFVLRHTLDAPLEPNEKFIIKLTPNNPGPSFPGLIFGQGTALLRVAADI